MYRLHFDYEVENRTLGDGSKEDENLHDRYSAGFDKEDKDGVMLEPASKFPDQK